MMLVLIRRQKWVRWHMVAACALMALSACGQHGAPVDPGPQVTQPFSLAKQGVRANLDFQVDAASFDLKKQYMVGLNFDRRGVRDPLAELTGRPPRRLVSVKVSVVRVVDGKQEKIPTIGNSQYLGSVDPLRYPGVAPEDPTSDIFYAYAYGWTGSEGSLCLVRFNVAEYGHYRAIVETIQDDSSFENIQSDLTIEVRFNRGE